jgi:hypothetical protein
VFNVSLSDGIGIAGIVFAIVIFVLDKAGKLKGGWLLALLIIAAFMTMFIVLGNSWVTGAPDKWKLWRGLLMFCIVAFAYSGISIWIFTGDSNEQFKYEKERHPKGMQTNITNEVVPQAFPTTSAPTKEPQAKDSTVLNSGKTHLADPSSAAKEVKRRGDLSSPQGREPVQSLRRPIEVQADMLRNWIGQTVAQMKVHEMWLSQIFQRILDNRPDGPDVDVPAALRYLNSKGEVEILETSHRPYRTWWGEVFQEDIRFKVVPSILNQ